ncbi:MAG: DNA adenine methylase [Candidatus Amulumruptor caecigallinarius]|nr:DNA adenine methylase [Candidatus Amulumruptor caecigallinarius]MCM1396086.1 DNA adenine methylase [Candidatus Amulumruptor caecigallinarius]MCM1453905.1 DNA adenine methylase [bacterium]
MEQLIQTTNSTVAPKHRSIDKAKPFLKWAGGKSQLLNTIDTLLPRDFNRRHNVTYIEPFVGGGAMLFHMLKSYPNISKAIINDINNNLVITYRVIRDLPIELIESLSQLQASYRALSGQDQQKEFYLDIRTSFNSDNLSDIEVAAYMIFLNHTCFNGLYRENSKGEFNVPFGRYANPVICDKAVLLADSELLQRVEILHGDYSQIYEYADSNTFVYFDPPYRPLDATSSFNTYVKEPFGDAEQIRLKEFYERLSAKGCTTMLSNSDCKGRNPDDCFFDNLYMAYNIKRVLAKRSINANPNKRGFLTELLILNYTDSIDTVNSLF